MEAASLVACAVPLIIALLGACRSVNPGRVFVGAAPLVACAVPLISTLVGVC